MSAAVVPFLTEMEKLVVLNEDGQEESDEAEALRCILDDLWGALNEEEQSFVRCHKKSTAEWRPNPKEK